MRLSTNESSPVAWLEGEDLRPAGDHVGLGAAAHLDGDVLVVAGQENLDIRIAAISTRLEELETKVAEDYAKYGLFLVESTH